MADQGTTPRSCPTPQAPRGTPTQVQPNQYFTPGPVAGVGTPGWVTNCGVFRGPFARQPNFSFNKNHDCLAPNVFMCDVSNPRGIVKMPFEIDVPIGGGLGAQGEFPFALFTTEAGVLAFLQIVRIMDSVTGAQLVGDALANMTVADWRAARDKQTYPSIGSNTEPASLRDQDTEAVQIPLTEYSGEVLTDGNNPLPPKVATVNLMSTALGIQGTFRNALYVPNPVRVTGFFGINYNSGGPVAADGS